MAYFRLRKDAEKWFAQIYAVPPFKVKWDMYYLCLMAGLASGRATEPGPSTDLVERWVEEYRPVSRYLIGLLVAAELRSSGIAMEDKAAVKTEFKRLLDAKSPNDLSDVGVRRMNAYASGGFEYLSGARDQRPYAIEEFLESWPAEVASLLDPSSTP
ncbi:hypothetical protein [Brevundimonas sp.]|jgi:hypothetical protein|uniref:hypothetical protein n=1 Tax=Brevundimonas sp. TaxID=1871086 RepID=UPI0037BE2AA3